MSEPARQETEEGPPPKQRSTVQVLLVEDDLDHAALVSEALPEARGFKVTHVRTGSEALELLEERSFDVCLVDYRLPDYEGVHLCSEIRAGFQGPLLLITSLARESAVERAFQAGVDDYVIKDASLVERLADEVARHLEASDG